MVRPCVARRFRRMAVAVLHQCIRPLIGAFCAPGHHGYQRACVLIRGQASIGPFGSPVFARARKTDPPFRLVLSQTSARCCYGLRRACTLYRAVPCSSQWPFLRPAERRKDQAGRTLASSVLVSSKARPLASTAQAMRASLLASAIASTLWCNRLLAASILDLSPQRSQFFILTSTTHAACT